MNARRGRAHASVLAVLLSLSCENGREREVLPADSRIVSHGRPDSSSQGAATPETGSGDATTFDWTVGMTDMPAPPRTPATLRDVRSSYSAKFERVVFDFGAGPLPGYHVRYVAAPAQECGSGADVVLAGSAVLSVRFESAQAHDQRGDGAMQATVTSRDRALGYAIIRQLRLVCDFEGSLEWVFGLTAQRRYRLLRLENPARLAVDIEAVAR